VAERVVDDLEAIQIDEQQREAMPVSPRVTTRGRGAEQRAIGQPRERVIERQAAQAVLGALALERVADRALQRRRGQLGLDEIIRRARPERRGVDVPAILAGEYDAGCRSCEAMYANCSSSALDRWRHWFVVLTISRVELRRSFA
jgi:hypothetical protein